jgi:mannose-6-phosphate isomerase-like protein (cupin superfamily)
MSHTHETVLIRAAEAEVLQDGALSTITLLTDSDTTGDAVTTTRALLKPGSPGAPSHFHTRATETFFVLDGSLRVLAGDEIVTLEKGDTIAIPPKKPHAFAPAPGTHADVLVIFTPGMDRFDYYRLLQQVHNGEATFDDIRASQDRFDNHYIDSPVWKAALSQ